MAQNKTSEQFWKQKRLSEMTHEEWERLCDGCGRCCLHKLEDEDEGHIYYTRAVCALLDIHSCRCKDYARRQYVMPDCVVLSLEHRDYFDWLPESCAYRLLAEGKPLPDWHPLVSGDPDSVFKAGISVRSFAITDYDPDNLIPEIILLEHVDENRRK